MSAGFGTEAEIGAAMAAVAVQRSARADQLRRFSQGVEMTSLSSGARGGGAAVRLGAGPCLRVGETPLRPGSALHACSGVVAQPPGEGAGSSRQQQRQHSDQWPAGDSLGRGSEGTSGRVRGGGGGRGPKLQTARPIPADFMAAVPAVAVAIEEAVALRITTWPRPRLSLWAPA